MPKYISYHLAIISVKYLFNVNIILSACMASYTCGETLCQKHSSAQLKFQDQFGLSQLFFLANIFHCIKLHNAVMS